MKEEERRRRPSAESRERDLHIPPRALARRALALSLSFSRDTHTRRRGRERNALDIELYEWARNRTTDAIRRWRAGSVAVPD